MWLHPNLRIRLAYLAGGEVDGRLQREEDGEPAEHVGRVRGRVDAERHVAIQLRVKVAGKAVAHRRGRAGACEAQLDVPAGSFCARFAAGSGGIACHLGTCLHMSLVRADFTALLIVK
jgi:hypothetical protein